MFAIRAAHAFDGERFLPGATVLVEGRTIAGVEPLAYDVPDGCPVHDHEDATVLPGLVDAHVHLVADSGPEALERVAGFSDEGLDAVVTEALRRQLAAGVTMVRDLGDRLFNVVGRRDQQRAHDDGLPWIVASGPPLTSPGGHCHYLGGEVSGDDAIDAALRERVERGVDVVKVMASGGMNTRGTDVGAAQFSLAGLRRIVEGAHAAGLPVTAHSHAAAGIEQAIAVGADGIEHASYLAAGGGIPGLAGLMNIAASDQQLADLAASGILVCPTLGGFTPDLFRTAPPHLRKMLEEAQVTPEQIVETRLAMLTRMHAAGVRFVSGTDAGIAPSKAHGLFANAVVELGPVMTVPEVLATATSAAAAACGLGGTKGRLRTGHDADVVVVDGDVSRDLTALRRVREVVVRGGRVGVSEP